MEEQFQSVLKQYWGYDSFRGIQLDIIRSIASGRDTLGLMPTGGGKSITFQVPALCMEGVCIVITPLIALMKDQVARLRKHYIQAAAIYAGMSHDAVLKTLENAVFGGVKILYVSPERLSSELFMAKLRHTKVSFITVDEAHCISQWGYDFRPSYLQIATIRQLVPQVPVLALTATATPAVVSDIQQRLAFRRENVFRMSFARENLAYIVRQASDKLEQLLHILRSVQGCAIVYVHSRKRTTELAQFLCQQQVPAHAYHAGLDSTERDQRQEDWQRDRVRVMVATNAFGMGIDKADVRLVVHYDCPDSPEAYFQEAGRAGRDGKKAWAVLLTNDSDRPKLQKRIDDNFPPLDYIRQVYEHLAYFYQVGVGSGAGYSFEFNIDKFCHFFHHFPIRLESALAILTRAGYIAYEEERDNRARVHFRIDRNDFYKIQSLSRTENDVITALLRNYGGLFTDYCFIDEALVAEQAGLESQQQVYLALKSLREKRILDFVPERRTPRITYTLRREDAEHIILPPDVYDLRKQDFADRIGRMIDYFSRSDECRQRMLLDYFGEQSDHACGHCDVCLARRPAANQADRQRQAAAAILRILADGALHSVADLHSLDLPSDLIDAALRQLVADEQVFFRDGMIFR